MWELWDLCESLDLTSGCDIIILGQRARGFAQMWRFCEDFSFGIDKKFFKKFVNLLDN